MAMSKILCCDEHKCPLETSGFCILCGYCPDTQSTYLTFAFSMVQQLKGELIKTYEFIVEVQGALDDCAYNENSVRLNEMEQRMKKLKREVNEDTRVP